MNLADTKQKLEEKKSKRDELKGKKDFLMGRIKELGYSNLNKAKKALLKLTKDTETAQIEYNKMIAVFEEKWGDFL